MATIYRVSDLITLKIDDLVVKISPLTYEQKLRFQEEMLEGGKHSAMKATALVIKFALKSIEGLKTPDGEDYKLEFENGSVSDKCWDDLQNIDIAGKLASVCLKLIDGVPKQFTDTKTGKTIKGVEFINEVNTEKKP